MHINIAAIRPLTIACNPICNPFRKFGGISCINPCAYCLDTFKFTYLFYLFSAWVLKIDR